MGKLNEFLNRKIIQLPYNYTSKGRSCLCSRSINLPLPFSPPIPISQIVHNIRNVLQLPFVELF